MNKPSYSDDYIAAILNSARTFAFVGASANPSRPSYFAMKYLLAKGYQVHPINPGHAGKEILGRRVFGSIGELPGPVDVLDIFRTAEAAPGIVKEALGEQERLGLSVVWMQIGVVSDEAAELARAAGLQVVMDRCPKIEYGRLSGEIGWAGVNMRTTSSRKPKLAAFGVQNRVLPTGR